jgi:A/G-specific adenine glycosylase
MKAKSARSSRLRTRPAGTSNIEHDPSTYLQRLPRLRRALLRWFETHQRQYPWRRTGNWFHLLMAEMMLRRTRADQVVPVYREFCERFETPAAALELSPAAFRRLLQPLGLTWRSRQLRETLHYLRDTYERRAPAPSDSLEEIPGVGSYSSAMLRNRLFEERIAAIDCNVARFICRLLGWPYHAESRRKRGVIELANRFVNSPHSRDLNLAILDLSALVCKPRTPLCTDCPLQKLCETGLTRES